jgi:hypothetical protein
LDADRAPQLKAVVRHLALFRWHNLLRINKGTSLSMEESSWLYNPNLYERPGCVLQADGTGFEPQAFLQQTTLTQS